MTDQAWELQQSLYTTLKTATLGPAAARIFDDPPQGPPDPEFPYVEIGEQQSIPDDTSGTGEGDEGSSDFFDLHIWSRHRGYKEIRQIASRIREVLHGKTIPVPGRASAHAWVRNTRMFRDPDGVTRHGVVTVEIISRS